MVIKYAVMVLTLVISAGCATTGSHDHSFPVVNGSAPTVSDTQQMADAAVGERVLLDGAAYRVASRYHAASGRECKQLRHEDTGAVRASCESKGQWYLREPLAGLTAVIPQAALALAEEQEAHQTAVKVSAITEPHDAEHTVEIPAAYIAEADHNEVQQTVTETPSRTVAVNKDENLWRFAKRVTGNANKWTLIAEFNAISDTLRVREGQRLKVPEALIPERLKAATH